MVQTVRLDQTHKFKSFVTWGRKFLDLTLWSSFQFHVFYLSHKHQQLIDISKMNNFQKHSSNNLPVTGLVNWYNFQISSTC